MLRLHSLHPPRWPSNWNFLVYFVIAGCYLLEARREGGTTWLLALAYFTLGFVAARGAFRGDAATG